MNTIIFYINELFLFLLLNTETIMKNNILPKVTVRAIAQIIIKILEIFKLSLKIRKPISTMINKIPKYRKCFY